MNSPKIDSVAFAISPSRGLKKTPNFNAEFLGNLPYNPHIPATTYADRLKKFDNYQVARSGSYF